MEKEIILKGRGTESRLVQTEDSPLKYRLITDFNYRAGILDIDKNTCSFIDPSGGPFIGIGSEIEGHKVKCIYGNGIIEFEL